MVHVVRFLDVEDMVRLNATTDMWNEFWHYYHRRQPDKDYLNRLKRVYYGHTKRAVVSHRLQTVLSKYNVSDQMETLRCRKTILYYFVAMVVKMGPSIVYKYNQYADRWRVANRHDRTTRIKWMLSSWDILRGSRNDIFRRQCLTVT